MNEHVLKALAVTAELLGTELTKHSLLAMESDLRRYPEAAVLEALVRCRREVAGRLTLAVIMERVEAADGRPAADEAWAIALGAIDEAATVVWSAEICDAFELARPILEQRDKVGARMAFRDAYTRLVREARDKSLPAKWSVSLGWDAGMREQALLKAAEDGRLERSAVAGLLPPATDQATMLRLASVDGKKVPVSAEQAKANLAKINEIIGSIAEKREQAKIAQQTAVVEEGERQRAVALAKIAARRAK